MDGIGTIYTLNDDKHTRTWPSRSWFSMKSWKASLLLSPTSFARVLNGPIFWKINLLIKKVCVFVKALPTNSYLCIKWTNPFRTLSSCSFAPSFPLHFSSFDKSLILSRRSALDWISWKSFWPKNNIFFHRQIHLWPKTNNHILIKYIEWCKNSGWLFDIFLHFLVSEWAKPGQFFSWHRPDVFLAFKSVLKC